MIKLFDVDLDVWEVEKMTVNSWDVTTGEGEFYTNYQIKIIFKKKKNAENIKILFDKFVKECNKKSPVFKDIKYNKSENNLFEIDIFDLHLGKLAWRGETREDYDFKIARDRFNNALGELIEKGKIFGFEKILFPVGNDFFHYDNENASTTKGTQQDTDVRWQKMYRIGVQLWVDAINYLRSFAPVDVVCISGNHDEQTCYYAGEYLKEAVNALNR